MSDPDRPLITIMLHHRSELGLSPEQVSRLEALRGEFSREAIRRDAEIRIAELDLASLLEQEPLDLAKVEAKVREVGAAARRSPDRAAPGDRAGEGGADARAADPPPDDAERRDAPRARGGPGGAPAPRRSADTGARL